MKTLSDLKQDFMTQVNSSHVKYGWDCGHSYSYIDHSLGDIVFDNNGLLMMLIASFACCCITASMTTM